MARNKMSYQQSRSQVFAASGTGGKWSLTGNLMGSTMLYLVGYLFLTALSGIIVIFTGVLNLASSDVMPLMLVPLFASMFLIYRMRKARSLRGELFMGALVMVLMGPWVAIMVALVGASSGFAVVWSAVSAVAISVVATSLIVYVSPWDLSKLSGLAFVALIALIASEFINLVLAWTMGVHFLQLWYFIGAAVFELYLVVDISRVRRQAVYGPNDGLAAWLALDLALDIINLFFYMLMLFSGRGKSFK